MSKNPLDHDQSLYEYLKAHSLRESEPQRRLREATAGMDKAVMQVSPDQGQFMALLVRLLDARTIVEIGTFTGYSALSMAQAMAPDGRLYACDISREWTDVGRPFWEQAGVADRIEVCIAPALQTLERLSADGLDGQVDLVFIDADKTGYHDYYEAALGLLRPGGLVVVDNVFWSGAVADPSKDDEDTRALREISRHIHQDERVDGSMIAVGDGIYLARKR